MEYQLKETATGTLGIVLYATKAAAEFQAASYAAKGIHCEVVPYSAEAEKSAAIDGVARIVKMQGLLESIAKMQLWKETTEHKSQLQPERGQHRAEGDVDYTSKSPDYLENQDATLETIILKARELSK